MTQQTTLDVAFDSFSLEDGDPANIARASEVFEPRETIRMIYDLGDIDWIFDERRFGGWTRQAFAECVGRHWRDHLRDPDCPFLEGATNPQPGVWFVSTGS